MKQKLLIRNKLNKDTLQLNCKQNKFSNGRRTDSELKFTVGHIQNSWFMGQFCTFVGQIPATQVDVRIDRPRY